MSRTALLRNFVMLATCCLSLSGFAQSGQLRAGAAKVDISPTPDMFPIKDMQLYGSLHDPLYARVLVLDNGSSRLVLVSLDAVHFPKGATLTQALAADLGIGADHLIINATHDHNAPGLWDGKGDHGAVSYSAIVQKGVLQAAHEAIAKLGPARIGFGTGKAYVNVNRDEKIGEGYHMGYNPEGPSDKTVAVMSVTRPDGQPIAVYANYPVHSVVMYRAHTRDGQVQVNGDLGGWASSYVEDHLKGAVALWTMGAAGDQNPVFMANYNQDAPDVHDEGPASFAILDEQARRVGQEIVRVAGNIHNTSADAVLWAADTSVTCPGQQPAVAAKYPQGYLGPARVKMVDGDPVTIPLHLAMVNDIAITGVSGEVYTEIGEHVKRDSLFDRTMMVTMMPDGIGYIPTDQAYLMPSEKAITNAIRPGCAEPAIVGAFLDLEKRYLSAERGVTPK